MRDLREILRQKLLLGRSPREAARAVGISPGSVASAATRAQLLCLDWEAIDRLDDEELERRMYGPRGGKREGRPEPDHWTEGFASLSVVLVPWSGSAAPAPVVAEALRDGTYRLVPTEEDRTLLFRGSQVVRCRPLSNDDPQLIAYELARSVGTRPQGVKPPKRMGPQVKA